MKDSNWWTGFLALACAGAVAAACGSGGPAPQTPEQPTGEPSSELPGETAAAATESSNPEPIPHPVEGREACTSCHVEAGGTPAEGAEAMPEDHTGRDDTTCQGCHTPPS